MGSRSKNRHMLAARGTASVVQPIEIEEMKVAAGTESGGDRDAQKTFVDSPEKAMGRVFVALSRLVGEERAQAELLGPQYDLAAAENAYDRWPAVWEAKRIVTSIREGLVRERRDQLKKLDGEIDLLKGASRAVPYIQQRLEVFDTAMARANDHVGEVLEAVCLGNALDIAEKLVATRIAREVINAPAVVANWAPPAPKGKPSKKRSPTWLARREEQIKFAAAKPSGPQGPQHRHQAKSGGKSKK